MAPLGVKVTVVEADISAPSSWPEIRWRLRKASAKSGPSLPKAVIC
jgi:hypothetical protein